MIPKHDPMTMPFPMVRSFAVDEHHLDDGGTRISFCIPNEGKGKNISIVRFLINNRAGSYGAAQGLWEIMYFGGEDVEGFCDWSRLSEIICQVDADVRTTV